QCGKLTWTTASETNCDYFQVWASPDNETWNLLGTVNGAGNSNQIINYVFETDIPGDFVIFLTGAGWSLIYCRCVV
ncbi:MAG: hypothetical protein R6X35_00525, partial [Candidatus Krumholzibacteriia bacterium]